VKTKLGEFGITAVVVVSVLVGFIAAFRTGAFQHTEVESQSQSPPSAPITFLSVTLNQPLPALPKCDVTDHPRPCQEAAKSSYGSIALWLDSKVQSDFVFFGDDVGVGLYERFTFLDLDNAGNVGSTAALTTGVRSQELAFNALEAKFGQPTNSDTRKAQNLMGASVEVIHATWNVGDATVDFEGAVSRLNSGIIRIQTRKYLSDWYDNFIKKPKPNL
jgi:hypothetical protein